MAANTWDDAKRKFESGVHSNGDYRTPYGTGIARPFVRKAAVAVKRESHAKRRCDTCGVTPPMVGGCQTCN